LRAFPQRPHFQIAQLLREHPRRIFAPEFSYLDYAELTLLFDYVAGDSLSCGVLMEGDEIPLEYAKTTRLSAKADHLRSFHFPVLSRELSGYYRILFDLQYMAG